MPRQDQRTAEEASRASRQALLGGIYGGAKWGLITGGLGFVGYFLSPIYKGLTIQFKVYIQLSSMVFGGWLEADRRLRAHEVAARLERKRLADEETWRRWGDMIEEQERKELAQKQGKP